MRGQVAIMRMLLAFLAFGLVTAAPASATSVHVTMRAVDQSGVGNIIGTIEFHDSPKGLKIIPNLHGLTPGQHGTHVHENPDCGPARGDDGRLVPGLAAGGPYDPENTGRHTGPLGDGHLGGLPVLYVGQDGRATRVRWEPRLTLADLTSRSIVIHAGGDNYADEPEKLGGGGAPVACGVVVR